MKDLYEDFAYDYDEFGSIENYLGKESDFFKQLFDESNVNTVLDCACGTGQHLYMLSELGYSVTGSDYSEAMLDVASRNLNKLEKNIPLFQCDFRYLEKVHKDKFDAIVCLTTSLPHLHTDEDILTALISMKSRLQDHGVLVLTQGTTQFTLTMPSIEVVVNKSDFSRIFVKDYDNEFQAIHVLDLYHSKERMESNQYDIVYKIILDDDYKRLLLKAGFKDIMIYGDYNKSPYNHDSKRLIAGAK